MIKIISTIYFLLTRAILHIWWGAVGYLAVIQFFEISKLYFCLLILLPLAAVDEIYQHEKRVADEVSEYILVRESMALTFMAVVFVVLYFLKNSVSSQLLAWLLISATIILSIGLAVAEKHKPAGHHLEWKHFFDIATKVLGPIILYPIIEMVWLK